MQVRPRRMRVAECHRQCLVAHQLADRVEVHAGHRQPPRDERRRSAHRAGAHGPQDDRDDAALLAPLAGSPARGGPASHPQINRHHYRHRPRRREGGSRRRSTTPRKTCCRESGRPGSNRRRPAWEAVLALAGFFGGGNGITQYARADLAPDVFVGGLRRWNQPPLRWPARVGFGTRPRHSSTPSTRIPPTPSPTWRRIRPAFPATTGVPFQRASETTSPKPPDRLLHHDGAHGYSGDLVPTDRALWRRTRQAPDSVFA